MRLSAALIAWRVGLFIAFSINIYFFIWAPLHHDGLEQDSLYSTKIGTGEVPETSTSNYFNVFKKSTEVDIDVSLVAAQDHGRQNGTKEVVTVKIITVLPSFATDGSEYVLGSLIERDSNTWNLHLTTFMLCNAILESRSMDANKVKVHPVVKETWRRTISQFTSTKYLLSGARKTETRDEKFYCKIFHSSSSTPYYVSGHFMPNRLTTDPSSNRLLDIMRCPIIASESAHDLVHSDSLLTVEIIKGNASIIAFHVPWKTRRTGFLLSSPKAASQLEVWKGYNNISGIENFPEKSKMDELHICVPSTNRKLHKEFLPVYLEFVSHHLLIGASHIYLPVPFGWQSRSMRDFILVFQSYIKEGTWQLKISMHPLLLSYSMLYRVSTLFNCSHLL